MAVAAHKRRLTIEDYHQMVAVGILAEDERIELLEGAIYEMTPIGNRHAAALRRLLHWLAPRLGSRLMHDAQNPLPLPDQASEPQPDLVLLPARADGYRDAPPLPTDVLLVVEIADSSLAYDREVKLPLYAAAGIPEAWIVDLPGEALLVCRQPSLDGYREIRRLRRGDAVSPLALPGETVGVDLLLG